ncbi:MAG TPA: Dabb family protein [Pirellulales bacterium]|nr:Dabb family protein [Pirellulales bacterium]
MRIQEMLFTLGLTAATAMLGSPQGAAADDKPARVLRHVVLYKFKDDLTPQQIQQVVDAFARLPKSIDTIIGYEHGTNVSTEGKSQGFTHVFVVTFRDEQGRDAYLAHPAHAEYVQVVRDRREKVVVFDYWAEP